MLALSMRSAKGHTDIPIKNLPGMSAAHVFGRMGDKGDETLTAGEAAVRTRDEITEAIRAFTDAQWARLRLVAKLLATKKYAGRLQSQTDDLLQEAFKRALEGDRKCPRHIDVIKFLAEVMSSIAVDEARSVENRSVRIPIVSPGEPQPGTIDLKAAELNAEEETIDRQNAEGIRNSMLALFPDDLQARDLLEGVMEELSMAELCELTGLDEVAYSSKRKLIRRRINKHFPEGWKP